MNLSIDVLLLSVTMAEFLMCILENRMATSISMESNSRIEKEKTYLQTTDSNNPRSRKRVKKRIQTSSVVNNANNSSS
jgi:hypothetical protein